MTIDLKRDNCDRWKFYSDWIQGKELAVWSPGNKWNATAKNRLSYALRKGYFATYGDDAYNDHLDDIYAINTSAPVRQGREMSDGYKVYPTPKHLDNPCKKHRYDIIAVMKDGYVWAYAVTHIMGDLMNISTIIGHADKLKDGIMLILTSGIQYVATQHHCKAVTYGTWDSGMDGLRYFKHSTGFKPTQLHEG